MECPSCGAEGDHRVTETRKDHEGVYRRRRCYDCGAHFVTLEAIVTGGIPKAARPRTKHAHHDLHGDGGALQAIWGKITA